MSKREFRARVIESMIDNHNHGALHRRLFELIPSGEDLVGSDNAAQVGDNKASGSADGSIGAQSGSTSASGQVVNSKRELRARIVNSMVDNHNERALHRRLLDLIPDEDLQGTDSAAQVGDNKASSTSDEDKTLYKRLLLESLAHNDESLSRRLLEPIAQLANAAAPQGEQTNSSEASTKDQDAEFDAKMNELDEKLDNANFAVKH